MSLNHTNAINWATSLTSVASSNNRENGPDFFYIFHHLIYDIMSLILQYIMLFENGTIFRASSVVLSIIVSVRITAAGTLVHRAKDHVHFVRAEDQPLREQRPGRQRNAHTPKVKKNRPININ
jgi:hypothetical protein